MNPESCGCFIEEGTYSEELEIHCEPGNADDTYVMRRSTNEDRQTNMTSQCIGIVPCMRGDVADPWHALSCPWHQWSCSHTACRRNSELFQRHSCLPLCTPFLHHRRGYQCYFRAPIRFILHCTPQLKNVPYYFLVIYRLILSNEKIEGVNLRKWIWRRWSWTVKISQ